VILAISFDGGRRIGIGRLFVPTMGGLELLISSVRSALVTLNSCLSQLERREPRREPSPEKLGPDSLVGRRRHRRCRRVKKKVKTIAALIRNPSKCTGAWTGTLTLDYSNGSDSLPLTASGTPA
jgi:hypothetical protein